MQTENYRKDAVLLSFAYEADRFVHIKQKCLVIKQKAVSSCVGRTEGRPTHSLFMGWVGREKREVGHPQGTRLKGVEGSS